MTPSIIRATAMMTETARPVISVEAGACPACAAFSEHTFSVPYLERDFAHVAAAQNPFAALQLMACHHCGFGWAIPPVGQQRLETFYRTVYRAEDSVNPWEDARPSGLGPLEPRAVAQLLLAKLFRTFTPGEAMLDIGPGRGTSFESLAQLLPQVTPFAFEADPIVNRFLEQARGVHVFAQPFSATLPVARVVEGRTFHLVLMSHVVEHFDGPEIIAVLENVRRLLARDGLFLCEVPHCDLRRHATTRRNDSPHLSFFSREGLRAALVAAGFTVRFLETCSQPYDTWWQSVLAGSDTPSPPQRPAAAGRLGRRLYHALRAHLPTRFDAAVHALVRPDAFEALWRSEELNYGGERTCLRAVASHG